MLASEAAGRTGDWAGRRASSTTEGGAAAGAGGGGGRPGRLAQAAGLLLVESRTPEAGDGDLLRAVHSAVDLAALIGGFAVVALV